MTQGQITEITKHGAAAGEAGRPERTDLDHRSGLGEIYYR